MNDKQLISKVSNLYKKPFYILIFIKIFLHNDKNYLKNNIKKFNEEMLKYICHEIEWDNYHDNNLSFDKLVELHCYGFYFNKDNILCHTSICDTLEINIYSNEIIIVYNNIKQFEMLSTYFRTTFNNYFYIED